MDRISELLDKVANTGFQTLYGGDPKIRALHEWATEATNRIQELEHMLLHHKHGYLPPAGMNPPAETTKPT